MHARTRYTPTFTQLVLPNEDVLDVSDQRHVLAYVAIHTFLTRSRIRARAHNSLAPLRARECSLSLPPSLSLSLSLALALFHSLSLPPPFSFRLPPSLSISFPLSLSLLAHAKGRGEAKKKRNGAGIETTDKATQTLHLVTLHSSREHESQQVNTTLQQRRF